MMSFTDLAFISNFMSSQCSGVVYIVLSEIKIMSETVSHPLQAFIKDLTLRNRYIF